VWTHAVPGYGRGDEAFMDLTLAPSWFVVDGAKDREEIDAGLLLFLEPIISVRV
jgi:hypothetical protein